MNGDELLQGSHPPETEHCPLPPSERQVRVFGAVVEPTPHLSVISATEILQGSAVRPKPIGDDDLSSAMPFHGFPEELQRGLAISRFGDDAFEHLALVVDRPPKIVALAVDLHENLVQVVVSD